MKTDSSVDIINDENICRICLSKQDTVYSLFRKRIGLSPSEQLNKIGLKVESNDEGPLFICCECLNELETTIRFLEKCEKSNEILASQYSRGAVVSEQIVSCKGDLKVDIEPIYDDNRVPNNQDVDLDSTVRETSKSDVCVEEPKCGECGSKRRCKHWTPPTRHTCPHCQKVFSRKFNLKLHLTRHSGERDWSCLTCGARTISQWLAARHCLPRRRLVCPERGCGKTYTTNTNLQTHMRQHTGERPFECSDCGKTFTSKNTLSDHVRIHTGALPYICPICGKRFRTNKLSAHMSTHSSGSVPCARAGCPARCASRAALRRHARVHAPHRAREHACALCAATYYHKQSLNKHMRKQHGQKPGAMEVDAVIVSKETQLNNLA